MKRKHERDLERDRVMLVFKILHKNLSAQLKFKVDMNAQQFHLNGVFIIADQHTCAGLPHIVIVEGGPTATKRYKKLLLDRIQWNAGTTEDTIMMGGNTEQVTSAVECSLVWEGTNPQIANVG